jgi:carboxyl-terminal processing protease
MRKSPKVIVMVIVLLAFLMGGAAGAGGYYLYDLNTQKADRDKAAFDVYWEVWRLVKDNFYGKIPEQPQPVYAAIKGSLQSLSDPYTLFVAPEPRAIEKAQLEGQFGGIGAYVRRDEKGQVILEPMPDSPAEKAGLKSGDILIKIDGVDVKPEMTTDEIVLKIRGEIDTFVTITVRHAAQNELVDLKIKRAVIETPSVAWKMQDDAEKIGLIKIAIFSSRTNAEVVKAIDELKKQGAKRYILDLRNDGGGLLDSAIDVGSQFLRQGVMVYEKKKTGPVKEYMIHSGGKLLDEPLVVLVNGGTASASEILAGALQDYGRAQLIGEKTYGKGSVQLVFDLEDKSSLHVTIARWLTPKNRQIDGQGLKPDIEITPTEADVAAGKDVQIEAAIKLLINNGVAQQ